jgi:pseudouridine synthase
MQRLNKYLSQAGVASRRQADDLIAAGRVTVNGLPVTVPGSKVDEASDRVELDGRLVSPVSGHIYVMLHKPRGYVSTVHDPHASRSALDLVRVRQRLYPVGRLDKDSEGLLLLTDDGELTQRLTHPRFEHEKEYRLQVAGFPTAENLRRLRQGIDLEDGRTAPARVEVDDSSEGSTWLRFTIHEGRKRQLRRMCEAIGHPVHRLIRMRLGTLHLGDLAAGKWRFLSEAEKAELLSSAGLGSSIQKERGHVADS